MAPAALLCQPIDLQPLLAFLNPQAYSNNLVDYHLILDLLPHLAATYLSGRLPATLSYGQAAILLTLGLQQQELDAVEGVLGLPGNQVRARGQAVQVGFRSFVCVCVGGGGVSSAIVLLDCVPGVLDLCTWGSGAVCLGLAGVHMGFSNCAPGA